MSNAKRYKIFAINAIRAALSPGFWLCLFFSSGGALLGSFGMFCFFWMFWDVTMFFFCRRSVIVGLAWWLGLEGMFFFFFLFLV